MLSRNQTLVLLIVLGGGVFLSMLSPASSETLIQDAGSRARCDLLQSQTRRFILNLNRINSPFTENQGQFDEAVRFAAIGVDWARHEQDHERHHPWQPKQVVRWTKIPDQLFKTKEAGHLPFITRREK